MTRQRSHKTSKTTKKNSMIDEELRKGPKQKRSEEKETVQNAKENRTTMKSWVEQNLSKFPIKIIIKKGKETETETE